MHYDRSLSFTTFILSFVFMLQPSLSRPWLSFFLVAIGVFLATMDSSMVNVALPTIMRSFATTLAQTEWVALIYLLTITVTLLIWGRLADRLGKRKMYLLGMLVLAWARRPALWPQPCFSWLSVDLFRQLGPQ